MNNELDHIMIGAASIDAGKAFVLELFQTEPIEGGTHSNLGTRNVLIGCGPEFYIEVLAADETSSATSPFRSALEKVSPPETYTFIVRTDDLDEVIERAQKVGLTAIGPQRLERKTPEGETLTWRLLFLAGHAFGGLVPVFIDWEQTPNPATALPHSLELENFKVATPMADELKRIYEALEIPVTVESHSQASTTLIVKTNSQSFELISPASRGFELG